MRARARSCQGEAEGSEGSGGVAGVVTGGSRVLAALSTLDSDWPGAEGRRDLGAAGGVMAMRFGCSAPWEPRGRRCLALGRLRRLHLQVTGLRSASFLPVASRCRLRPHNSASCRLALIPGA